MADGGTGTRAVITPAGLAALHAALRRAGYRVIGPVVRDGAIVLDELESADALPYGVGVALEPGGYRLRARPDRAAFGHAAGPQSWKRFLRPDRVTLWTARRTAGTDPAGLEFTVEPDDLPRLAFLGVRPCDLRAIEVQDRVLLGGRYADATYAARRPGLFVVAVECTEPGATCFCASMGSGPGAGPGYDLALTELAEPAEPAEPADPPGENGGHRFVVAVGSDAGAGMLDQIPHRPATAAEMARAEGEVTAAAGRMGRTMPAEQLPELMRSSLDAARWDDVAERCLACGICTQVCPTCFCTSVIDGSDLSGDRARREQVSASCFDIDFSYLHGLPEGTGVRTSRRGRYRQWLTHKLGTWHDQFGSSGCVGCGRCVVWCPVGIDLTEEVAALRAEAGGADHDADHDDDRGEPA